LAIPQVGLSSPPGNVDPPQGDADLPQGDVDLPQGDVDLPQGDADLPQGELTIIHAASATRRNHGTPHLRNPGLKPWAGHPCPCGTAPIWGIATNRDTNHDKSRQWIAPRPLGPDARGASEDCHPLTTFKLVTWEGSRQSRDIDRDKSRQIATSYRNTRFGLFSPWERWRPAGLFSSFGGGGSPVRT